MCGAEAGLVRHRRSFFVPIAKVAYRVNEYVSVLQLQSLARRARRVDTTPGLVVHHPDLWRTIRPDSLFLLKTLATNALC